MRAQLYPQRRIEDKDLEAQHEAHLQNKLPMLDSVATSRGSRERLYLAIRTNTQVEIFRFGVVPQASSPS